MQQAQSHFGQASAQAMAGHNNACSPEAPEFNPTAAYLWLLSQQQQQQQQQLPNAAAAAAAAAALNLTSARGSMQGSVAANFLNGGASSVPNANIATNNFGSNNSSSANMVPSGEHDKSQTKSADPFSEKNSNADKNGNGKNHSPFGMGDEHKANGNHNAQQLGSLRKSAKHAGPMDEDTTDDEGDDMESNNSTASNHSDTLMVTNSNGQSPDWHTHFLTNPTLAGSKGNHNTHNLLEAMNSIRNSSAMLPGDLPQPVGQSEHCLETLLRNIEGLLAIAAHNARQQQTQLQMQKGEHAPI